MSAEYMSDGGSGGATYAITSIDRLETSAENLSKYNQQLTNNANSLGYIVNAIRDNWQNEDGQDIQSILTNINDAVKTLNEEIQPVIGKYVQILNTMVVETRAAQNKSL